MTRDNGKSKREKETNISNNKKGVISFFVAETFRMGNQEARGETDNILEINLSGNSNLFEIN
jgi:hypothetical protein